MSKKGCNFRDDCDLFFPAKLAFLSNYLVNHFARSEDLEQDLLHSDSVSLIRSNTGTNLDYDPCDQCEKVIT